jgi:hypothetical protein
MKRILLTSTALVAFAGAAAADVSFSGTAKLSYNSGSADATVAGFQHDITITAAGSQALDNGYTASTSLTLDADAVASNATGAVVAGDISIANDSSSLTMAIGAADLKGAASLGASLTKQSAVGEIHSDDSLEAVADADDDNEADLDQRLTATASLAGATIRASLVDDGSYQLGVSTDLGGTSINVGIADTTYGVTVSGEAANASYALGFAGDNSYGINLSTTTGGADLGLNFGDAGWGISASMPLGAATMGIAVDSDGSDADTQIEWKMSVSTDLDGVTLTASMEDNNEYDLKAGYSMGAVSVAFATNEANAWSADIDYGLGNGVGIGVGTSANDGDYIDVDYDLGGGAAATVTWASQEDAGADNLDNGTTIAVSFSF